MERKIIIIQLNLLVSGRDREIEQGNGKTMDIII